MGKGIFPSMLAGRGDGMCSAELAFKMEVTGVGGGW
jgi:hypothetical protein